MKYSHTQYAQALYESLQDTNPKNYDVVIENFVQVLQKNGDLVEYDRIIAAYERYDKAQNGTKEVELTTAMPTTFNKPLLDELNKIVGTKTEIKQKIDSNLIGGVVLKVDDTLIDGSIKRQLDNLRTDMKGNN